MFLNSWVEWWDGFTIEKEKQKYNNGIWYLQKLQNLIKDILVGKKYEVAELNKRYPRRERVCDEVFWRLPFTTVGFTNLPSTAFLNQLTRKQEYIMKHSVWQVVSEWKNADIWLDHF